MGYTAEQLREALRGLVQHRLDILERHGPCKALWETEEQIQKVEGELLKLERVDDPHVTKRTGNVRNWPFWWKVGR